MRDFADPSQEWRRVFSELSAPASGDRPIAEGQIVRARDTLMVYRGDARASGRRAHSPGHELAAMVRRRSC